MNHIRRAAYFNSNGASLLAAGENKKAFQSFKTSLQTLARAIADLADDTPPPTNASEDTASLSNTSDMMMSRAVPRSPMACHNESQEPSTEQQGQPYLYSKGLVFYPNSTTSSVDLAFYSSVVVFNLVLTCHRKSSNLQESGLKKLLSLYDLCLRLIGESTRIRRYDCSNLMVATLNNKSIVHSELGQHDKARRSLYHVWDVMKHPGQRPGLLEGWEVEGIFLNIYLILVNYPQVAGAA